MVDIKQFEIAATVSDSLIEVFDMMLSMNLELSDENFEGDLGDKRIVGSVNLAGQVMGIITFNVSEGFSREMTAAMLGHESEDSVDKEKIKDAISEVCNIVGGNLKSKFCEEGLECRISPPSFTSGESFKIESLNTERHECFYFSYDNHVVTVEVGIKFSGTGDGFNKITEKQAEIKPVQISDIENLDIQTVITDSMTDMFDAMLSMELVPSEKDLKDSLKGDLFIGSVSFIGQVTGNISILVTADFCRQMAASMLGIEEDDIEGADDMKDIITEICNIVGGTLKSTFYDSGIICELSIPSFTFGKSLVIESQDMGKTDSFSFKHMGKAIVVQIALKSPEDENAGFCEDETNVSDLKEPEQLDDPQKVTDDILASHATKHQDSTEDISHFENEAPLNDMFTSDEAPPADLNGSAEMDETKMNIDFILDIPLEITVQLGQTRKPLKELLEFDRGSIIEFSNIAGEPVDIHVNDTLIAKGEVMVDKEKYGVRVTEIATRMERIQSLT